MRCIRFRISYIHRTSYIHDISDCVFQKDAIILDYACSKSTEFHSWELNDILYMPLDHDFSLLKSLDCSCCRLEAYQCEKHNLMQIHKSNHICCFRLNYIGFARLAAILEHEMESEFAYTCNPGHPNKPTC